MRLATAKMNYDKRQSAGENANLYRAYSKQQAAGIESGGI